MLIFLHAWIKNIVLIDNFCDIYLSSEILENKENTKEENLNSQENGWGSEEATQLLLNNLLFLTAKLSSEHDKEIKKLWKCLATNYSTNLPIIVHYLFMMVSLSLENMLPLVRIIFVFFCLYEILILLLCLCFLFRCNSDFTFRSVFCLVILLVFKLSILFG
ncbi:hypothetical protein ACQ4LE_002574 [Meloidogyne hapla]